MFDYKFVLGARGYDQDAAILEPISEEQADFGDLLPLEHTKENMNEGKTKDYFTTVGSGAYFNGGSYAWIAKMDMDTFPVMPNLLRVFVDLASDRDGYWGGFCQGEHWDLDP